MNWKIFIFILTLCSIQISAQICEITFSNFYVLNLDEIQTYSIDINSNGKINGYYRVYHLFGECYVEGDVCENAILNDKADAFLIHNDFFQIENNTIIIESLCNLTFPNMACESKKIGDKDLYTNRMIIFENVSGMETIKMVMKIEKTNYEIDIESCKDYVPESNPFPWLTNSTFLMVGFCLALICCIICCLLKCSVRIIKCIMKRC